jgi:L-aspartate oxidase
LENVRILEHGLVTDPLLDENGRCIGALARDESNRRIVIQSCATILATGGAGRLFELSLNPSDITGDGYAFGLRAGAELVNLEFMQAGFGILGPRMNAIFQYWLWELQPILTTETGESFLDRYIPAGLSLDALMVAKARHFPFSVSDISRHMEIGVQSFINEERDHHREGAVWMSLSGIEGRVQALPEGDNLRRMWDLSREMLLSAGVNLSSRFRVAPFAHAMNGGLVIDQFGRTSVEGLYAVGEVAGGPHGADRIGGNMFPAGQVFAERAGLHAALSARERSCGTSIIAPRPPNTSGPQGAAIAPQEVGELTRNLQRQASRALLVVREAKPLRLFASAADNLATRLEGTNPDELNAAGMELRSLVTTGRVMARAALLREESRGGHYRRDFSEKRAEWNTRIFLKLNAKGDIGHRLG